MHKRGYAMAIAAICALAGTTACAQGRYPERPVRIVVPYAPGGSVDTVARALAQKLGENWGQSVIVENRPGGGANIGTDIVAKATPDGYTLLMGTTANTVNVHLMDKMSHDFIRDFAPISLLDTFYNVLVVNAASSAHTMQELIALARAKPRQLTYASSGVGSSNHFSGELFNLLAQVDIVHVPYKAAPVALTDLLGNRVDMYFPGIVSSLPHIQTAKLRAFGVTGSRRAASAPQIPTIAEAGLPGYALEPWHGLLAPRDTPSAIITKIHRDAVAVLKLPEIRDRLIASGVDNIIGSTPAELAAFIRQETAKYGKLAKAAGLAKH
ncbi:MAG: tripartite tricarboxylate transporter substrate binding protein [Rhodospirillaceae bacterium]